MHLKHKRTSRVELARKIRSRTGNLQVSKFPRNPEFYLKPEIITENSEL